MNTDEHRFARICLIVLVAVAPAFGDDVHDLAARIEALAAKEAVVARADTMRRAEALLQPEYPELAAGFRSDGGPGEVRHVVLPSLTVDTVSELVEKVERGGDDPAAYEALAAFIRTNQLSVGLDNPSIRARIALAELEETLHLDFVLVGLDGRRIRLSDYRGKTVVLAFWATWCVPCRAELSRLEEISDVPVLAISYEPAEVIRAFLAKNPCKVPMFVDPGHRLEDHFRVDTLPATIRIESIGRGH